MTAIIKIKTLKENEDKNEKIKEENDKIKKVNNYRIAIFTKFV